MPQKVLPLQRPTVLSEDLIYSHLVFDPHNVTVAIRMYQAKFVIIDSCSVISSYGPIDYEPLSSARCYLSGLTDA